MIEKERNKEPFRVPFPCLERKTRPVLSAWTPNNIEV